MKKMFQMKVLNFDRDLYFMFCTNFLCWNMCLLSLHSTFWGVAYVWIWIYCYSRLL